MTPIRIALAASLISLSLSANGCAEIIETLTTEEVVVAVLVTAPDVVHPTSGAKVAGQTSIVVYYGELDARQQDRGEEAYTPFADAEVHLVFQHPSAGQVDLAIQQDGDGSFRLDSTREPRLIYAETDYRLLLSRNGKTRRLQVRAPPPTDIVEVAAAAERVIRDHHAGSALTVTRVGAAGPSENDVAFVSLARLAETTASSTWSNVPDDAPGFIDLLLRDTAWRADSFIVPGTELDTGSYVLSLSAMARGAEVTTAGTSPLFFASSFFAGAAASGIVVVTT